MIEEWDLHPFEQGLGSCMHPLPTVYHLFGDLAFYLCYLAFSYRSIFKSYHRPHWIRTTPPTSNVGYATITPLLD